MKGTRNNRSAKALAQSKETAAKQETMINLNEKMTLRKLLTLISSTKGLSIPTAKALRTTDTPVAVYSTNNFSIMVYACGFALAKSYKRTTVVRVDDCRDYKYQTFHDKIADTKKSATPSHVGFDVFLDAAWPVRIMLTAEDQLEENNNKAAHRAITEHPAIAADVKEYNRYVHGESVEDMVINEIMKEEMLSTLTDKQREVYVLYYDEGYTLQAIGEMLGVTWVSVRNRLEGAIKKIRKYYAENRN